MGKKFILISGLIAVIFFTGCNRAGDDTEASFRISRNTVDEETLDCRYVFADNDGAVFDLGTDVYCYSAMHSEISPSGGLLAYVDFPRVLLLNGKTGTTDELMVVPDDSDGVDFFWSEDSSVLAMTVVSQTNPYFRETLGTRLYIFDLEDGVRDEYDLKIRYECHAGGCNVGTEDLYFKDDATVTYRTWESETPYEDAGDDSLLRELQI